MSHIPLDLSYMSHMTLDFFYMSNTLDGFHNTMLSTADWTPGFWLAMGIHHLEYKEMCYTPTSFSELTPVDRDVWGNNIRVRQDGVRYMKSMTRIAGTLVICKMMIHKAMAYMEMKLDN